LGHAEIGVLKPNAVRCEDIAPELRIIANLFELCPYPVLEVGVAGIGIFCGSEGHDPCALVGTGASTCDGVAFDIVLGAIIKPDAVEFVVCIVEINLALIREHKKGKNA
jgi:hypothetical protein